MYKVYCFPDGRPQYEGYYHVYWIYDGNLVRSYDAHLPTNESIIEEINEFKIDHYLNRDQDRPNISIEWFYYRPENH